MICDELVSTLELLNLPNSLVVTGEIPTHTEVCNGLQILRPDLKTMHEEADVIIPHQVVYLASLECCSVKVIRDDTDVFMLLVHYYAEKKLTSTFSWNLQVKVAHQLTLWFYCCQTQKYCPTAASAHAMSGCDTDASYFGRYRQNQSCEGS